MKETSLLFIQKYYCKPLTLRRNLFSGLFIEYLLVLHTQQYHELSMHITHEKNAAILDASRNKAFLKRITLNKSDSNDVMLPPPTSFVVHDFITETLALRMS